MNALLCIRHIRYHLRGFARWAPTVFRRSTCGGRRIMAAILHTESRSLQVCMLPLQLHPWRVPPALGWRLAAILSVHPQHRVRATDTLQQAAISDTAGANHDSNVRRVPPTRVMRLIKSATSVWQLQHNMHTMPDGCLNSLHLAAALTHAAQLSMRQPLAPDELAWCASLALQATAPGCLAQHQPRQVSNMMWAIARLGLLHPDLQTLSHTFSHQGYPQSVNTHTVATVHHAWEQLDMCMQCWPDTQSPPPPSYASVSDYAISLQACVLTRRAPSDAWMTAALDHMTPQLTTMRVGDAATLAWALKSLGHTPTPSWMTAFLDASKPYLEHMSWEQMSMLVWALPSLLTPEIHTQQLPGANSKPQNSSNASSSLSAASQLLSQWREELMTHITPAVQQLLKKQLSQQSLTYLAALLWGFSQLRWTPPEPILQALLTQAAGTSLNHAANITQTSQPPSVGHLRHLAAQQPDLHYVIIAGGSPTSRGEDTTSRLAASSLWAVTRFRTTPPPEWLDTALASLVWGRRYDMPVRGKSMRDISAGMSSMALLQYRPPPGIMAGLLSSVTPENIASATTHELVWCIWSCAKLKYMPPSHILHALLQGILEHLEEYTHTHTDHTGSGMSLGHDDHSTGTATAPVHTSTLNDPQSSPTHHLPQLLWSLAVMEDLAQSTQTPTNTTTNNNNNQMTATGQPTPGTSPAPGTTPASVPSQYAGTATTQHAAPASTPASRGSTLFQSSKHITITSLTITSLTITTPAYLERVYEQLARHFQHQSCPPQHLAQLCWALGRLSSKHHPVPGALRSSIMCSLAHAAPTLPLQQLVACCIALPRMGCTRRLDSCGLLAAVLAALSGHWKTFVPSTVASLLQALAGVGYVLKRTAMQEIQAQLLSNELLLRSRAAKALHVSCCALHVLGQRLAPTTPSDYDHAWRDACMRVLTSGKGLRRLNITQVTQLVDVCTELGWQMSPSQWCAVCKRSAACVRDGTAHDAAQLLFAAATYCTDHLSEATLDTTGRRSGPWWTHAVVTHVMSDLDSLSPGDVARLLVSMVRLRHDPGGTWLNTLGMQLETHSALLNKADHGSVRQAWAELGKRRRLANAHQPQADSASPKGA